MKIFITLLIVLFCLQLLSCGKDDNIAQEVLKENNDTVNYLQYTMDGLSFQLKDSLSMNQNALLGTAATDFFFFAQKKNGDIQVSFEWILQPASERIGTFGITKGIFIDTVNSIDSKDITGTVTIEKLNYPDKNSIKSIEIKGTYKMNITIPNKENVFIEGNFYYEGENNIWF